MQTTSFDELYGTVLRSHGIATVPLALFRYQARLGLSLAQIGLIGSLLSFRWTQAAPYPSLKTLEAQTGVARSTLFDQLAELARNGFVTIERRRAPDGGLTSNAYHFDPLFEKLIALILVDQQPPSDGDECTPASREPAVPPSLPPSNGKVSGRPDRPFRHGRTHLSVPARPGVTGHDRTKVDSSEVDEFEVDPGPSARNCADDANPPPEPQPPEPPLLGPTCHQLAYRLARAARRPGWHKSLAGELADYVTLHNLTPAQLERLVRLTEGPQPPRTEEELWLRLDPYRLAYVQPKAQPACLVGAKPLPISAIVPASPPTAAVGSSLEIGRRA